MSFTETERMLLNDNDAIINILIRLPLRTLIQCKTVCKWWHNLISNPVFIATYSQQNPHHYFSGFYLQKFLFLELYSELEFLPYEGNHAAVPRPSLSFIEDNNGVCIRDSCNGLLLCSSFRCCNEEERMFYVCKPTTKQFFPLPKPPSDQIIAINVVYNPKKSPYYQIVCICDSKTKPNYKYKEIKIYSSRSKSWRDSGNPSIIIKDDIVFKRGIYTNGKIHWVGIGEKSLTFDVEKEEMQWIPMPAIREGWSERRIGYFGESRGNLYLIENYGPCSCAFDVMEMRGDYSRWTLKYHVDLNMGNLYRFNVLQIVHEKVGEEYEPLMVLKGRGGFMLYNMRENGIVNLTCSTFPVKDVGDSNGLWYNWEAVFPYTNTLCYI
ncbi:F-box protein At5g07610-like [Mangifera indica]|uniref:F-box protein At5g07610-like n=1 Tax=Mangifera indica TaxID=29780 RepID=UPI001CFA9A7E|nr:F-box protein At5g07610-like [Mangifera indica]XP_044487050.1 F-box protein At5g07610-like [Mangifera indica]